MKTGSTTTETNPPVAIIGMGCFFPKASGLKEYWRLLFRGQDAPARNPAQPRGRELFPPGRVTIAAPWRH